MPSSEEIKAVIDAKIRSDEMVSDDGDTHEGAMHLNYEIMEIGEPVKVEKGWEVTYKYLTFSFNNFTLWSSGTPLEYVNQKTVILDQSLTIIEESEKKTTFLGGGTMFNLEMF